MVDVDETEVLAGSGERAGARRPVWRGLLMVGVEEVEELAESAG